MNHFPYNHTYRKPVQNLDGIFDKIEKAAGKFTDWVGADTRPLFDRTDKIIDVATTAISSGVKVATGKESLVNAAGQILTKTVINGKSVLVDQNGNQYQDNTSSANQQGSVAPGSLTSTEKILLAVGGVIVAGGIVTALVISSNEDTKDKRRKNK